MFTVCRVETFLNRQRNLYKDTTWYKNNALVATQKLQCSTTLWRNHKLQCSAWQKFCDVLGDREYVGIKRCVSLPIFDIMIIKNVFLITVVQFHCNVFLTGCYIATFGPACVPDCSTQWAPRIRAALWKYRANPRFLLNDARSPVGPQLGSASSSATCKDGKCGDSRRTRAYPTGDREHRHQLYRTNLTVRMSPAAFHDWSNGSRWTHGVAQLGSAASSGHRQISLLKTLLGICPLSDS